MSSNSFHYDILIVEKHLDFLGHVNNAAYLALYEEARWDFMTKGGIGLTDILKNRICPVILDCKIKYKKEILNREMIRITSFNFKRMSKIFVMDQEILKQDDEGEFTIVASEASFHFGLMHMDQRTLVSAPSDWANLLNIH